MQDFFHQQYDLRFPAHIPGKKQKSWGWGAFTWLKKPPCRVFWKWSNKILDQKSSHLEMWIVEGMQHLDTAIYQDKIGDGHARLQICPLYSFGNKPPQMVPKDLNIGETRVWRLVSGPNPQPWHGTGNFRLFSPPPEVTACGDGMSEAEMGTFLQSVCFGPTIIR